MIVTRQEATMVNARPLGQKVGVAAALGAALTGPGCSSDSTEPQPQPQTDGGGGGVDALSELMQEGSPEDVADALEEMLEGGGGTGGSAPLYKGVTFP
jgi:hypothetical protein